MRFTSPFPARYCPVAYLRYSFEAIRQNTGMDYRFAGPDTNLWVVTYCHIESIHLAFASRLKPASSELFLFIEDVSELVPSVARTIAKSAIDQIGGSLSLLLWYDADALGDIVDAPDTVAVKKSSLPSTTSNPAFEDSFTDFMSDSPLLPDGPRRD